jgi:hypothetical protein
MRDREKQCAAANLHHYDKMPERNQRRKGENVLKAHCMHIERGDKEAHLKTCKKVNKKERLFFRRGNEKE